ncbi:hypothetical protein KGA66_10285 [Actinocrinis puniceicyclus]|uniref:Uncharacterized protein n=1 Tax=Actinocrinis puniceicyclus TaxID=977794 RepID=A0A8J7WQ12_9ACTN|nr:hypothetical protein [Actinocrinis puniceicyclus]MBS2963435.1 hypothetical protein [Actinocrinis puniceicyclus]
MSSVPIPGQIRQRLAPVVRTLAPLLDAGALARASNPDVGLACRATVEAAWREITAPSAVYAAWDARGWCRYVGSVYRQQVTAVGDRLAEHHRHPQHGPARRRDWVLMTVLPIRAGALHKAVLAAEGWAARLLVPLDGGAHPAIDLMQPPDAIAAAILTTPGA